MKKKGLIGKFLFKKILYLGENNYLIHRDSRIEEVGRDYHQKPRVIILGKKYYFETSKKFPFSNIKDIKSAIEMDISTLSPFKTDRFFIKKIGKANESTSVNLWFVDEKLSGALRRNSPLIIIPETAIFPFFEPGKEIIYTINKEDENLLVYIGSDGMVKSISDRGNKTNMEGFKRSIGAEARDCPERGIAGLKEYLSLFPGILTAIPLKSLLCFLNIDFFSLSLNKRYLKMGLAAAVTLFLLYTGILGILLYHAKKGLQSQDRELSLNLEGPLKKQLKIENYFNRQDLLARKINTYTYKLPIINMLNGILPEKTTIRRLTVSGNVVQIRGSAVKASGLLTALSNTKGIQNARFTSPLREDRKTGMERFTISFIYIGQ